MEFKLLKTNKHVKFKYSNEDTIEAGIVLTGIDVKDFKNNNFEIRDSIVKIESNEAILHNLYLGSNPEPITKKLLLKKREIQKIKKILINRQNHIYVNKSYINNNGFIKFELGIGKINKKYELRSADKRMTEKRSTEKYIAENT